MGEDAFQDVVFEGFGGGCLTAVERSLEYCDLSQAFNMDIVAAFKHGY